MKSRIKRKSDFWIPDSIFVGGKAFYREDSRNYYSIGGIGLVSKEKYFEEYHKIVPKGSILTPIGLFL